MRIAHSILFETLEPRTLLSASIYTAPLVATALPVHPLASVVTSATAIPILPGININAIAHVPFTGEVAFYPSPVLDPPLAYGATINWGDGGASKATLQYGMQGTTLGCEIIGAHTYNNGGTFKVSTTLFEGPLPGSALALPTRIIALFVSTATVAPGNSTGGVTIDEVAGVNFTANLGSFITIAPATNLHAAINWGDGTTSAGLLTPTGVIGVDTIQFEVSGTHTYANPGTFAIHIVVTQASPIVSPTAVTTPVIIVATIDSTAIVAAPTAT